MLGLLFIRVVVIRWIWEYLTNKWWQLKLQKATNLKSKHVSIMQEGQSITPWLRVTQGPLTWAKLIFVMVPTVTSWQDLTLTCCVRSTAWDCSAGFSRMLFVSHRRIANPHLDSGTRGGFVSSVAIFCSASRLIFSTDYICSRTSLHVLIYRGGSTDATE